MAEEATWKPVVLIPKSIGDYRDIFLVKLVWKVVTMIINRRLNESIAFHSFLRGFQAGRSTGTASLDTKLLRKLMAMR